MQFHGCKSTLIILSINRKTVHFLLCLFGETWRQAVQLSQLGPALYHIAFRVFHNLQGAKKHAVTVQPISVCSLGIYSIGHFLSGWSVAFTISKHSVLHGLHLPLDPQRNQLPICCKHQAPSSAHSVPTQCPLSAHSVPTQCPL